MRNNNALNNTLLMAWTLASAPMVIYFVTHGRIRLGVLAGAIAVAGLVLGSRLVQWAVVGAMAGATIGGVGGWFLVDLRGEASDQIVLAVLLGGFVGVFLGTLAGALLARATEPNR